MTDFSFVFNAHPNYIASLYEQYQRDPESVEESWRLFFRGFDFALAQNGAPSGDATASKEQIDKELRVYAIIVAYRNRGHLRSQTNPIRARRDRRPNLDLADFNLTEADLERHFVAGREIGLENATLRRIIEHLEKVYCGHIGFEFMHIRERVKRRWLRERIERIMPEKSFGLSIDEKRRILEKLNGAVVFEKFLNTKYVGQKRFSLEGGESTIPALDFIINKGAALGVEEFVMGMAHRGRLNVLANILGKTYEQIFNEFEDFVIPDQSFGDGDVKYHMGYSSQVETPSGKKVHLKLAPNPSHLESVDPVVEGFTRAKGDLLYDNDYDRIMPILIHGDAAIAGQGVVYETVQMSQLQGYYTGGTVHFVINNQVGFTTDFYDARSSTYCTDVAKVVDAPVFHVNGDDPEAVVFVAQLAAEYRQTFHTDVFIDMVCYRRHGHNEGDDPQFTQPEMYQIIKKHPDVRTLYVEMLTERGDIEKQLAEELEDKFWKELQARLDEVKEKPLPYEYQPPEEAWRKLKKRTTAEDFEQSPVTGVPEDQVRLVIEHLLTLPDWLNPVSKVKRLLKHTRKLWDEGKLDWAMAELLAYGTILLQGQNVRMSGQDVRRGTFSHRHAVFYDNGTEAIYNRLEGMQEGQGKFYIFNSLLSEFGVLGFEYGYSLATPDTLVIWEAQFGDFANGAQVIFDQYISSAESKWQRQSGLVMLLPHGYEGQGPEHSSARLERYLQASAEYNITVANCTTPANFFHLLRRQLARPFRKPLVVMTPKSLLRHPRVISSIDEFTGETRFRELIDDPAVTTRAAAKKVKTLLLCSGKIYYELLAKKEADQRDDVAIVRLEQLYPLPEKQLDELFAKYKGAAIRWVQEEPANMGAWQYVLSWYCGRVPMQLVSRKPSASPATGFKKKHDQEQQAIIEKAFA